LSEYLELHALADGQLEGEAKLAAESRLRTCERSKAEYEAVQALKQTLETKCESLTCEKTWSRCQGRLREIEKTKRVENFVGKYAWGICGAFLLCIVVGGSLNRSGAGVRPGDVARVSASMSPLSLGSSTSERRRVLEDFMGGPMRIEPEKVQVVGAAKGVLNGHNVVKLDLADPSGPMAFFLFQNASQILEGRERDGFCACVVNGTNGLGWSEGQRSYLLIGDRPIDDLQVVAQAIRGK
jgi:hypothetical protein